MLFTSWLLAIIANELLLWEISYLNIISPLVFTTLGGMYLYQRQRIKSKIWIDENMRKIESLNLKILFLVAMLTLLAVSVNMKFMLGVFNSLN